MKFISNYFLLFCFFSNYTLSQAPQIISISPSFNEIASNNHPEISAVFDVSMDSSSFDEISFAIFAERSGYHSGIISYNDVNKTTSFNSLGQYNAGERVTVTLSNKIRSQQGDSIKGFSWVFRIPSEVAPVNFDEAVTYNGGGYYMQVVDINNDNYPDIATSSGVILLNDGNGNFNDSWLIPDIDLFYPLVVNDFNRDGLMDIFFRGIDGLKVGIGDGAGNFNLSTKPFWFYDFGSGDLNGDGYADIYGLSGVIYVPPDSITLNWSITFNDGSGNFNDTIMYKIGGGGRPERIITTDIDNDGDLDVVIASHPEINSNGAFGLNGIIVGKNESNHSFNSFDLYYSFDIQYPYYLNSSDFNNDGFNDIAVISSAGGVVELNSDDGTFLLDSLNSRNFWQAELASPITGGDIDGDNWIDIVISGYEWPPVWQIPYYAVNINNKSYFPGFSNNSFNDTLPDGNIRSTSLADLNNDGKSDILHCGNGVYITFNRDTVLSVNGQDNVPNNFYLFQNYPNPFNSSTTIEFGINEPQLIRMTVFNLLGEEVKSLENKRFIKGKYKIYWDGRDNQGFSLPSGIYFVVMYNLNQSQSLKLLMLK